MFTPRLDRRNFSHAWEGRILLDPRGEHGFGYDPVFYMPTHDCVSAELAPEVKNALSHRGTSIAGCRDDGLSYPAQKQG